MRLSAARTLVPLWALLWLTGPSARADEEGVRAPLRLTVGGSDELLGQLSPDRARLYFASNAGATFQIMAQDMERGVARPLFEEPGDVSWPRVSPRGDLILYISHREDAAGDLCVRRTDGSGRRCLADARHADLQALWLPGGDAVALLSRRDLHGNLLLRKVRVGAGGLSSAPWVERNLSAPALSPDGRWMVFVPVTRSLPEIGVSFAARATGALALVRTDGRGREVRLEFALPGASGLPAFSPDGRHLYFTHYLNDTNLDGSIDGNDHGVIFRVPFESERDVPVAQKDLAAPLQLTSAAWNCQYPAPAADRLIMTCAMSGSLDIYSLPLDGSVPDAWGRNKLLEELAASQESWEQLLLHNRLLRHASHEQDIRRTLLTMIRLHLGLGELESSEYYARKLAAAGSAPTLAGALVELIENRRARRALDRGALSAAFTGQARARLERLSGLGRGHGPDDGGAMMVTLAKSEILDTMGAQGDSLDLLLSARADLPSQREPFVLHMLGRRAHELLSRLGDKESLLQIYAALSQHPAFEVAERLVYAERFVRLLERGGAPSHFRDAVSTWRERAGPGSELLFRLDLESWLVRLSSESQEEVRKGVFALYRQNPSLERRRALIGATVRLAARHDNEYLTYQFANTWVSGLPVGGAERRRAEQLYRQVVNERAYIDWAKGSFGQARGHFYGVTLQTDSLESHIGFIEACEREGRQDVRQLYEKRYAGQTEHPVFLFVSAYLIARQLPSDRAPALRELERAIALLRRAAARMGRSPEIQHLWGYLAHRRFLHDDEGLSAQEASTHYLLALDLARENPRLRASILEQLGVLHASVGNFRLALSYLVEREKLPMGDRLRQLLHLTTKARCHFHLGEDAEADRAAQAALALQRQEPALSRFLPLVVNRAALYALSAGRHVAARGLYAEVAGLPDAALMPVPRYNRLAYHLGRASSALSAGLYREAIEDIARAQRLLGGTPAALTWPPQSEAPADAFLTRRLLLLGLGAQAHRELGQIDDAERAMRARRDLLLTRLGRYKLDEDRLELAMAEGHLAEHAVRRRSLAEALRHLGTALSHADAYGASTGTPVHPVSAAILGAYAELMLFHNVSRAELPADLEKRLLMTYLHASKAPSKEWKRPLKRLALYLTMMRLESGAGALPIDNLTRSKER